MTWVAGRGSGPVPPYCNRTYRQRLLSEGGFMRTHARQIALVMALLTLTACNTISGAGKDLSSAGKAISKTAEDVKN
jgi:predicted small secreted protein